MTPEEQAALLVELAGMKRECIFCRGTGYTHEPFAGRGQGGQNDPDGKYVCEGCHGVGEVYLLDTGVRVPCAPIEHFDAGAYSAYEKSRPCSKCAGRGWTPTENYFVLEQALVKINLQVNHFAPGPTLVIGTVNGSRAIPDIAEAALTALARR